MPWSKEITAEWDDLKSAWMEGAEECQASRDEADTLAILAIEAGRQLVTLYIETGIRKADMQNIIEAVSDAMGDAHCVDKAVYGPLMGLMSVSFEQELKK